MLLEPRPSLLDPRRLLLDRRLLEPRRLLLEPHRLLLELRRLLLELRRLLLELPRLLFEPRRWQTAGSTLAASEFYVRGAWVRALFCAWLRGEGARLMGAFEETRRAPEQKACQR